MAGYSCAACVQQELFSGAAAAWVVPNTFSVHFHELWALTVTLNSTILGVKAYHKIEMLSSV